MRINFKRLLLLTSAIVGIWAYRDLSQETGRSYIKIALRKEVPDSFVNPAWFTDGPPKRMEKYDPETYKALLEKYRVPGSTIESVVSAKRLCDMTKEEKAEHNKRIQAAYTKSGSLDPIVTAANDAQLDLRFEIYNTIVEPNSARLYEQRCCEGKDKCLVDGLQRWLGLSYEDAWKYLEDHTDTSSGYKNVTMPVEIFGKHSKNCAVRNNREIYIDRPPIDISKYVKKQDGVSPKPVAEKSKPVQVYAAGYSSPKINVGN